MRAALERVGIDLTDMIAGSQGYRYVFTIIDYYSRFVKFYPLKSKHTHAVIEALGQYVADYEAPQGIVLASSLPTPSKGSANTT